MKIPILSGALYDIQKFDFYKYQIKILNIENQEFEDYISKLNERATDYNLRFLNEIKEENKYKKTNHFAIIHTGLTEDFDLSKIYNVWKFILILFPSDLNIQYELNITIDENYLQISSYTTYSERITGEYPGKQLICNDPSLLDINNFISNYFCNLIGNTGYIRLAVESYTTSYYSSHLQHQYLQLMMSLESILEGNNELSYRLRRSIAVLIGDDKNSCQIIFDNLNKLYDLRSKIIHGENFFEAAIKEYLPCLKSIVSKVIMELLIHNIPTRKLLNSIINELGYGAQSQISENWKNYYFNPIVEIEVKLKALKKIKTAENIK